MLKSSPFLAGAEYSVKFELVYVIPAKVGIQLFIPWIPHQVRNDNL